MQVVLKAINSLMSYKQKSPDITKVVTGLLVRVFITYLMKSTGTNAHIQPHRRDIFVSVIRNEVLS